MSDVSSVVLCPVEPGSPQGCSTGAPSRFHYDFSELVERTGEVYREISRNSKKILDGRAISAYFFFGIPVGSMLPIQRP